MADANDWGSFSYVHQQVLNENYLAEGNLSKEEKQRLEESNRREKNKNYSDSERFSMGNFYLNGHNIVNGTKVRFGYRDFRNDFQTVNGTVKSLAYSSEYSKIKFNIVVEWSDSKPENFEVWGKDIDRIKNNKDEWVWFH